MEYDEIMQRATEGRLFYCDNEELIAKQLAQLELLYDFNATRPTQQAKREELLKKMFAEIGEECYIEPPLHSNWAGGNVHFGKHIYANFNLTLVDDGDIFIGDHVMIGPNVSICTAAHPICPELRYKDAQYNLPIYIKQNVWIGAGVIILPGVTIGENSVIGAGSIVTRDIPANVVAVGNPCRVMRTINENDRKFFHHDCPIDIL